MATTIATPRARGLQGTAMRRSGETASHRPTTRNRAYIENGEVKLDIVTETMSIEEARELTLKAVELEYSLP